MLRRRVYVLTDVSIQLHSDLIAKRLQPSMKTNEPFTTTYGHIRGQRDPRSFRKNSDAGLVFVPIELHFVFVLRSSICAACIASICRLPRIPDCMVRKTSLAICKE
jgi:hypothetical protein